MIHFKTILLGAALLFSSLPAATQIFTQHQLSRFIENPALTDENQLPPRSQVIPFQTVEEALEKEFYFDSDLYQSLNGTWQFKFHQSPLETNKKDIQPGARTDNWHTIQVPGTWQMQGYGHKIYRNIPVEFSPFLPPQVPSHFNPTGIYATDFELAAEWPSAHQVLLHFEGVKSAFWVWVNGNYVGFNKGSMTSAEWDISPYINREGKNRLAVMVVRWSDGTYLENQDMWRFSGIYRDVFLYAKNPNSIQDIQITTALNDEMTKAEIAISHTLARQPERGMTIENTLYDAAGNPVSSTRSRRIGDTKHGDGLTVQLPILWSDETPYRYTLITTLSQDGQTLEVLKNYVGVRTIEIRGKQLLVNGVAVKMKGVNRHEHDAFSGRTMNKSIIMDDFKLMKQLNVNAIRLAHYPNTPLFYHLADKYGFLLCDEVNIECHYKEHTLGDDGSWDASFLRRTEKMVQRTKNHPSVIIWSMGNECGLKPVHYKMADYVRSVDPTRPIYHQPNEPNGTAPFADIDGIRYPPPSILRHNADTSQKPIIMGEYSHAMGNALGHFDEYWDLIYEYPNLQGGYVWDWMDQGLIMPLIEVKDRSAYQHQAVVHGNPDYPYLEGSRAIALSGLDDFVEITPSQALNIATDDVYVSFSVYPRHFSGEKDRPINHTLFSVGESFSIEETHDGYLQLTVLTDKKHQVRIKLPDNWNFNKHKIQASYQNNTLRLQLNEERKAQQDGVAAPIKRTRHPINIGRNHQSNNEQHPGFISNAVYDDVIMKIKGKTVLHLDFEEFIDTRQAFLSYGATPINSGTMDGVVSALREPEPEAYQMKHSHQPIKVKLLDKSSLQIEIENRQHFSDMKALQVDWRIKEDGVLIDAGIINTRLPAGKKAVYTLQSPARAEANSLKTLVVSTKLIKDTWWAKKGYEVAFDEFVLQEYQYTLSKEGERPVMKEDKDGIVISGKGFSYSFDKHTATLRHIIIDGDTINRTPPLLSVHRVPIMNEIATWGVDEYTQVYELGLDSLTHQVSTFTHQAIPDGYRISYVFRSSSFLHPAVHFMQRMEYDVYHSGTIRLSHTIDCKTESPDYPNKSIPWLQKIGMDMQLNSSIQQMVWLGRGPFETYPDRKKGAKFNVYETRIQDISFPYLIPQAFGNHTDVYWVALLNEKENGIQMGSKHPVNVSLNPFSNLHQAWYPFQLQRSPWATFSYDYIVTGVGGTPVQVQSPYRTYPNRYEYETYIKPVINRETSIK